MNTPVRNPKAGESTNAVPARRRLREVVDAYQDTQRERLQVGERIQTAAQVRPVRTLRFGELSFPEVWPEERGSAELETLFSAIRSGRSDGPIPMLGRTYRREVYSKVVDRELRG